jgi:hypothetical protein
MGLITSSASVAGGLIPSAVEWPPRDDRVTGPTVAASLATLSVTAGGEHWDLEGTFTASGSDLMPCDKTTSRGPGWRVFSRGIRKGRLYFLLLGGAEVQGASLYFFLLAAAEVRCQSILLYTTCSLV